MGVSGVTSIDHSDGPRVIVRKGAIDCVSPEFIVVKYFGKIFSVRLETCDESRMNFSFCHPFQSQIVVALCCDLLKYSRVSSVQLLVVDDNLIDVLVCMQVQEKGIRGILRDSSIELAWRSRWA